MIWFSHDAAPVNDVAGEPGGELVAAVGQLGSLDEFVDVEDDVVVHFEDDSLAGSVVVRLDVVQNAQGLQGEVFVSVYVAGHDHVFVDAAFFIQSVQKEVVSWTVIRGDVLLAHHEDNLKVESLLQFFAAPSLSDEAS